MGGVYVPLTDTSALVRGQVPGGRAFWVGYGTNIQNGNGRSAARPYATLAEALTALGGKTNSGDVIYILPGHAETISAADYYSATGAASGFSIIGLGTGTMRPSFTWSAAGATWLIDTANVEIANCRFFMAGATGSTTALTVAAAMTVSAAGFRAVNNYFQIGVDGDQIITVGILTTAAADDLFFVGNFVEGATAAEITAAGTFLRLIGCDRAVVKGNYMAGALATDTDGLVETLTTLCNNLIFEDNTIYARGAGNTCAVDFGADLVNTGSIQRNTLVVDADGTAGTVVLTQHANSNFFLQDNFLINNNGERGLAIGTASV